MRVTKLWGGLLLGLVVAAAPLGARAQSSEAEVPEPVADEVEGSADDASETPSAGEALTAPELPTVPPEGYGDLRLPTLHPRREDGTGRVRAEVLAFHDGPLTLHIVDSDHDRPLTDHCTAPCRLDLEPGRYAFAIQNLDADPHLADDQPVWVSGTRVAIQMSYDHRIGLRSLGWNLVCWSITAFALSFIGGPIIALIIGLPLALGLAIPGVPLVLLQDSARVQVVALPE